MRQLSNLAKCRCGGAPNVLITYYGRTRCYQVICQNCGMAIGSLCNVRSAIRNWNIANRPPKDNEMNNFILDQMKSEEFSDLPNGVYLRSRVKQAKELYGCLVETDNARFRNKVQDLADGYLDEVFKGLTKKGYIF